MRLSEIPRVSSDAISSKLQYFRARATHSCVFCESDAKAFSTPAFEMEYKISALCEDCQIALGIADYSLKNKAA